MPLKILIDMIKLRDAMVENPSMVLPEAYFHKSPNSNGLKTIRELATFRFTCRRCKDAPCIAVCPADALEKDEDGIISRHTNLCISCKSCVTICPFGTMMNDFFRHHRNKDLLYDLGDDKELAIFVSSFPPGIVSLTDIEESPEENIYDLNGKVLIRDHLYVTESE